MSIIRTKIVRCGRGSSWGSKGPCFNPAAEPHICPLVAEGIRGNGDELCDCCDDCTGECRDDV